MWANRVLRFGIPSLDRLIGPAPPNEGGTAGEPPAGFRLVGDGRDAASGCIIGNDGTGKSVLALHLASRFFRDSLDGDAGKPSASVFYAATDLSYPRARHIWTDFALGYDQRTEDPFEPHDSVGRGYYELKEFHAECFERPGVYYLDLRAHSRGDDWGFLNRLVAVLEPPDQGRPRHLLVVDAVEGLEILVGQRDAFGQQRDRRSRVTQLIRTATEKCHLAFVVGDRPEQQQPEEYVTDFVLRLGEYGSGDYVRRVLSVEKVRGQAHTRGPHAFAIRSGAGSTTGDMPNPDDPAVPYPPQPPGPNPPDTPEHQSYLSVFHSVHYLSRSLMEASYNEPIQLRSSMLAEFGITGLDEMLVPGATSVASATDARIGGVPCQDPAALIGEQGSFKGQLSKSFLSRAVADGENSVAVLLTTKATDRRSLIKRLNEILTGEHVRMPEEKCERVLCRRLEIHHLAPAFFIHIVRQLIRAAQSKLKVRSDASVLERRKEGWRIRFVIDNWSTITTIYPELREDSRLLPYLLFLFRREGIPLLVVATEDHGFTKGYKLTQARELRDLTSLHIYTWRVPFFGESRVAVTVNPPMSPDGRFSTVRELKVVGQRERECKGPAEDKILSVHPTFELYQDLDADDLQYVNTQVHLYDFPSGDHGYVSEIRALLEDLVGRSAAQGAPVNDDPNRRDRVVRVEGAKSYEKRLSCRFRGFHSNERRTGVPPAECWRTASA